MRADGDGTPSLPRVAPCVRTAQCAIGPFHRRPRAAKMAAPHAGGSRSVAPAAKMAALHIGEPIMGSRRPGGSLLKQRERRFPDAPLRTGLSPMVGGSGSVFLKY